MREFTTHLVCPNFGWGGSSVTSQSHAFFTNTPHEKEPFRGSPWFHSKENGQLFVSILIRIRCHVDDKLVKSLQRAYAKLYNL